MSVKSEFSNSSNNSNNSYDKIITEKIIKCKLCNKLKPHYQFSNPLSIISDHVYDICHLCKELNKLNATSKNISNYNDGGYFKIPKFGKDAPGFRD